MTSREAPHHNTLTCYTNYGCRLPECVDRKNQWSRDRYRALRGGNLKPRADAIPVRQHIAKLLAAGLTQDRIASLAGVPHQSISDFIRKRPRRGMRYSTSPEFAARIFAIDPSTTEPVRVDATGTQRRIQALVASGWPLTHIAVQLGLNDQRTEQILRQTKVRLETKETVAAGFLKLRNKRPESAGVSQPQIRLARERAAARRWPPPRYWAKFPGSIDDPHFTPEHGMTKADRNAEEARWLVTTAGLPRTEVAARLGMTFGEVDDALALHRADMRKAA